MLFGLCLLCVALGSCSLFVSFVLVCLFLWEVNLPDRRVSIVYFKSAHPRVPSGLGGKLWVKTVGTWEKPDDTCNLFVFFCVCLSFCKISKDAPKLVVFKGYYNFSMLIDIGST